jgi:hypothetical protein
MLGKLGGAPSFLGGQGHDVVDGGAGGEKAEGAEAVAEVGHGRPPGFLSPERARAS